MDGKDLLELMETLIDKEKERGYWDFKREWHENNSKLLHDIICMANNLENRDAYLFIGIDQEHDFCACDISNDKNRKNTQNIVDLLRTKKFSGDIRPRVDVETIIYNNSSIDIIVIYNSKDTPFYLSDSSKTELRANHIYTRIADTNTPIDSSADRIHVQWLWEKRYTDVNDKLLLILEDIDGWRYKDDLPIYHRRYAEYRIEYDDSHKDDMSDERFAGFYSDVKASSVEYKIYVNNTIIYSSYFFFLDNFNQKISKPKLAFVEKNQKAYYYYFEKTDIEGKFLRLLNRGEYLTSRRLLLDTYPFLVFENSQERRQFELFVINNWSKYLKIDLPDKPEIIKAIKYEKENQWTERFCESIGKLSIMYDRFINDDNNTI